MIDTSMPRNEGILKGKGEGMSSVMSLIAAPSIAHAVRLRNGIGLGVVEPSSVKTSSVCEPGLSRPAVEVNIQ